MQGLLIVITAPSGAGKSSLISAALQADPGLGLSVSYTTRPPRPGEQNGREYHFVDEPAFLAMHERGEFLESAQVHGCRYATSQSAIHAQLAQGHDLILEIDWQGAQQVHRLYPDCIRIFILPPCIEELERRMQKRGQDSSEVIRRRMGVARDEIGHAQEFDYAIINKDFDEASRDLAAVIRSARLGMARQLAQHPELFRLGN
ncbi:MAG: guanylate kinase [Betaproteobacteria bacterium]|nr:guanylate kinase [Betaproteobacteria bacterium]